MQIKGEHLFAAPREAVWETVLDPHALSTSLPGFESLEEVGENRFAGALNIRVGPVQGKFRGTLELSDLDPPSSYAFTMAGKGAAGFVDGVGRLELSEQDSGTRLLYDVEATVGGRIAGVGQRLLDSSAKVLTRQALESLEQQIASRIAPRETRAGETTVAAPAKRPQSRSQAAFAARFARDLAAELVPPERRPLVLVAALALYTLVVVLVTRACS